MIITQQPLKVPDNNQLQGIRLVTYSHQRQLPTIKSLDYMMAIWLQPLVAQSNADEVLYHQHGVVSECPRANFFIVTNDETVLTPKSNILAGIIRQQLLTWLQYDYPIIEKDITLDHIRHAKEAFITSTTRNIQPVISIDGIPINGGKTGSITTYLSELLLQRIHEQQSALL